MGVAEKMSVAEKLRAVIELLTDAKLLEDAAKVDKGNAAAAKRVRKAAQEAKAHLTTLRQDALTASKKSKSDDSAED